MGGFAIYSVSKQIYKLTKVGKFSSLLDIEEFKIWQVLVDSTY